MSRPVRTCIGCRGRADKNELLRLVWRDEILVDPRHREPGRGAYLHPSAHCVEEAVRRRALARALRVVGIEARTVSDVAAPYLTA